ncbi:MAG: hypothetical protein E7559_04990 [Ruminococcaceae bacterium]|nr:hypothetical protein [Oscillospiraceae bacterium]
MKRIISIILAMALLLTTMVFVGCEKEPEVPEETGPQVPRELAYLAEQYYDKVSSGKNVLEEGVNFVKNGSFSESGSFWSIYTESGGSGEYSTADGNLTVNINDAGSVSHAVQMYYDSFSLTKFAEYEFSFVASSTLPDKVLEARLQLNGGDYKAYALEFINLTTEPTLYTIPFVMNYDTDKAPRMAFNMGRAYDGSEKDLDIPPYTIVIDDISLICTNSSDIEDVEEVPTVDININNVGYKCADEKIAVFRGKYGCETFEVVDDDGNVVYTGEITEPFANPNAKEFNYYGDFSEVTAPGHYTIRAEAFGESVRFEIGDDIYDDIFRDIVRMFYLQRCGCEIPKEFGGKFTHGECHTEDAVIYGTTKKVDVSGGWHDAGDYGRYVVAAAKAVADLLLAYEANPAIFTDDYNIPESGNGIPDILDEVRYELEWMLKMQDTRSGGVYHKVTCAEFPGEVLPERETEQLLVLPISLTATADFAAVMAMASRFYADIDADFAEDCLKAAKKAAAYFDGKNYGPVSFKNPEDVTTGEYPDHNYFDELCWAGAELLLATGDTKYQELVDFSISKPMYSATGLGWADVGSYAINTYLSLDESLRSQESVDFMTGKLTKALNLMCAKAGEDGYKMSLGTSYPWGSNMTVANNGMQYLMANDHGISTDAALCSNLAEWQLNYLFGTNPMSTCYITGAAPSSPKNPHHRPSQVKSQAMPGMLVGGPDSNLEDPCAVAFLSEAAPPKCYVDNVQSYSCNEITIYWNSPLVYLMARQCMQ